MLHNTSGSIGSGGLLFKEFSMTVGFDLHLPATPEPTPRSIEPGDVVVAWGWQFLRVNQVDGEDIYCDGFLDPFTASGLEIVS